MLQPLKPVLYFLCLLLSLTLSNSLAQAQHFLKITLKPEDPELLKKLAFKESYADTISLLSATDKILSQARFSGYLLADISQVIWEKGNAEVEIQLNKQYTLVRLANGNVDAAMLQQAGYRVGLFDNVPFQVPQLEGLFKTLLSTLENQGYPFASVWMDSIRILDANISARIFIDRNKHFSFDTVIIAGTADVSPIFLQAWLDIKPGSAYSEAKVADLNQHLSVLPFAESVKGPEVSFTGDKAKVILFLNKKNANQFDGILGFLPNDKGKMQISGDLKLNLQNAFKHAETIALNFKGLPQQSRELALNFSLPGIFSGPVGLNGGFNLFRQDTSYQNVSLKAGLSYRLSNTGSLNFFIDSRTGSVLSTQGFKQATVLPVFADLHTTSYGLSLRVEKLDYRINPTKGYRLTTDASAGKKSIKPNSLVNPDLYKNVDLNSAQYRLQSKAEIFIPLGKTSTINLANQSAVLVGNGLFENELFRLGGFSDLRGFGEQSLVARAYNFFNVEYRYLLERNSFLFLFANQAYINRRNVSGTFSDYPFGCGTGIDFETKAGIVSLSYALGKQHKSPLNFQNGKIHFGIIALF